MSLRYFLTALTATCCGMANAQSTFQRWVLPSPVEIGPGWVVQPSGSVQQLCPGPDGSIYGFDNESNNVATMNLVSVFRIDAAGALVQGKNWVFNDEFGLDTILIHAMAATADGGVLVAGRSYHAQPMGRSDLFTFKLDGAGDPKIYTVASGDFMIPRQLIPTSDGAIVLLADAFQGSMVAKLDQSGTMLWNIVREDITPISNYGCATGDGGVLVAGSDRIHVVSSDGAVIGMYNTSGIGFRPDVARIGSAGYAIGSAVTDEGSEVIASVVMLDTNMQVLWTRRFQVALVQPSSDGYYCRVLALPDGSLLTWFPVSNGTDLVHMDAEGNILDAQHVSAFIYTATLTSDGRIALGGYGGDGNLIVYDSMLSIGCSTDVALNTDPITVTVTPTTFLFNPATFNYGMEQPGVGSQDNLTLVTACISTGLSTSANGTELVARVDVNGDLVIDGPENRKRTFQAFVLSDMLGRVHMTQGNGDLPVRRATNQLPAGIYSFRIGSLDGSWQSGKVLIH